MPSGSGRVIRMTAPTARRTVTPAGHSATVHVSARADYGMRALIVLAHAYDEDPQQRVKGEQIATAQQIPPKFLEIILSRLRLAGIVISQRGAVGGYRLSRDPALITIADVVSALDGPIPTEARPGTERHDYVGPGEYVRDLWQSLRDCIVRVLEEVTLADVLSGSVPETVRMLHVRLGTVQ